MGATPIEDALGPNLHQARIAFAITGDDLGR
jgi:hypothetical protein